MDAERGDDAPEDEAIDWELEDAMAIPSRKSKKRAYFVNRKHRHESLMFREPILCEQAAIKLPVLPSFEKMSRLLQFRPSWSNCVAIFDKYTPVVDGDRLRMRVVGLAAYNGPIIDAFDIETGTLLYSSNAHNRPIHHIYLVPTATKRLPVFASCCHGGVIKLIELQTGKILMKVGTANAGPIYSVCFSEGKSSFLICGLFSRIEIWRVPSGRRLSSLEGHEGNVMSVNCYRAHPDFIDDKHPGYIASGDDRGNIRTWLLEEPFSHLLTFLGHHGSVLSLTSLPARDNGTCLRFRLLSTSVDRTIRVWDVVSGEPLACVSEHVGPVQTLSILRLNGPIITDETIKLPTALRPRWNENIVITVGLDKRVNFWKLPEMTLLHTMNREAPVKSFAVALCPRPFMILTAMDKGLELLDLTKLELPGELGNLVMNHESRTTRKMR